MILDIDIRVSNDNGVEVHQFTKHFDSKFEGNRIQGGNQASLKSFEEFLSEYLSGSGKLIRNQLITKESTPQQTWNESYNNIEYTLKLGDSQSVTGKIPLNKLFRLSEVSKISNKENQIEEDNILTSELNRDTTSVISSTSSPFEATASEENLALKRLPFHNPIDLSEVDKMFQQVITNAVAKYEDSFFLKEESDFGFTSHS